VQQGPPAPELVRWGRAELPRLVRLCAGALPDEVLGADDLDRVGLVGPPGGEVVVLAAVEARSGATVDRTARDLGAAIVSVQQHDHGQQHVAAAHLQLLVVEPSRRGRGVARALVEAAERWAIERGATSLEVGAGAPAYLFTGVDSRWTDALCCFEALGYRRVGAELDLSCATEGGTRPLDAPRDRDPVRVEHVRPGPMAAAVADMLREHHPQWLVELDTAVRSGTAVAAVDAEGRVLGTAAYSVNRRGVIGPVAVAPDVQGGGIGARLMAAVLAALSADGLERAEIAWVSTVRFYLRACGANVGRTSIVLRRELTAGR
jgi:GNAT superfamily N-acetyltransferase